MVEYTVIDDVGMMDDSGRINRRKKNGFLYLCSGKCIEAGWKLGLATGDAYAPGIGTAS